MLLEECLNSFVDGIRCWLALMNELISKCTYSLFLTLKTWI